MPATISDTVAWPTLDEILVVDAKVQAAHNALDELEIRCYRLRGSGGMELEPIEGVPNPTAEEAGVVAILCERLEGHIDSLGVRLDNLKELRTSAVHRVGREDVS